MKFTHDHKGKGGRSAAFFMLKKEPTETLTLRVPQSLKLQIEMAANKDGRTINSWVNKVMREYFETEKK